MPQTSTLQSDSSSNFRWSLRLQVKAFYRRGLARARLAEHGVADTAEPGRPRSGWLGAFWGSKDLPLRTQLGCTYPGPPGTLQGIQAFYCIISYHIMFYQNTSNHILAFIMLARVKLREYYIRYCHIRSLCLGKPLTLRQPPGPTSRRPWSWSPRTRRLWALGPFWEGPEEVLVLLGASILANIRVPSR